MGNGNSKKKLVLNRETLVPLQADDLDHVHGGWLSPATRSIVKSVWESVKIVSTIYSSIKATQESVEQTKKLTK